MVDNVTLRVGMGGDGRLFGTALFLVTLRLGGEGLLAINELDQILDGEMPAVSERGLGLKLLLLALDSFLDAELELAILGALLQGDLTSLKMSLVSGRHLPS